MKNLGHSFVMFMMVTLLGMFINFEQVFNLIN